MARPSKFNNEVKRQCKLMALQGWTDVQMSELLGVTEKTFNNWKKKYKKFFQSLKDWKIEADNKVERSLYERACGYNHPETKAQYIQDQDGGRWEYADLTKHYAPDPTSMIFWLKNRQPDKWRDKTEHELTGKDGKDLRWTVEIVDPKEKE